MSRYVLLGLLQGLTEFLPVSSSGHLVLAKQVLGVDPPGVALEAMLHLATLLAVVIYFRRDLVRLIRQGRHPGTPERRYLGRLGLGTLPIVVVGLSAKSTVEQAFSSVPLVGGMLIVTAIFLLISCFRHGSRDELRIKDAIAVGIAQAAALLPGISRSGVTVSAGIMAGVRREEAARFSFLLAIPAITGAGALTMWEARGILGPEFLLGALAAFASGLLAIRFFLSAIRRGKLWPFSLYCLALGLSALLTGLINPG